jgi:hypothetical protein
MFGMLPPSPLEPLWYFVPLIAVGIFLWSLIRSQRQKGLTTGIQLVVAAFLMFLFLSYVLFPPVARVRHRGYVDDTGGDPDLMYLSIFYRLGCGFCFCQDFSETGAADGRLLA